MHAMPHPLAGTGFSSNVNATAVFLPVPVSTTFLNGIIICDVFDASPTRIRCLTRAHLAADASADDSNALNVVPRESQYGAVQVRSSSEGSTLMQIVSPMPTHACRHAF